MASSRVSACPSISAARGTVFLGALAVGLVGRLLGLLSCAQAVPGMPSAHTKALASTQWPRAGCEKKMSGFKSLSVYLSRPPAPGSWRQLPTDSRTMSHWFCTLTISSVLRLWVLSAPAL